jgi:hypothetical protein
MAIERAPRNPVAQNYRPQGGIAYRVKDGDNWWTVAKRADVDAGVLIEFNFRTRIPDEVNWYLRRNVGCRRQTADRKNYIFSTDANPGIVYLPPRPPRYNYTVPGPFNIIAQPSSMACWATVGAMMLSWRDSVSYTIEDAMSMCGAKWLDIYKKNTGLAAADHGPFADDAGMTYEPMQCFPAAAWEEMLRAYGPLAVVTANPFHARIMVGISGDGTDSGTTVDIIDPNGGRRYPLNFGTFSQDFEGVSAHPRFQLWHF